MQFGIMTATGFDPDPSLAGLTLLAQRALTASAACGGRFTLGIGLSHKYVIEHEMGLSCAAPAQRVVAGMPVVLTDNAGMRR